MNAKQRLTCLHCRASVALSDGPSIQYCPYCGCSFQMTPPQESKSEISKVESAWSAENTRASKIQEAPAADEKVLFQLGPYFIMELIGKGGMGEVFRAYDTTCGRWVALKKIRVDLESKVHLHNRFLREARITSQLAHPAVIPIYAIHSEDHILYYTMPYVAGETLGHILRKTILCEKKGEDVEKIGGSIPALTNIFLKVCQAVAYAHSRGVLHRDLKPENVMVGKYGEVLILDWGLAKIIDDERDSPLPLPTSATSEKKSPHTTTHTRIDKVVGTVQYLSPERATGEPATVQSDIYALGVILYQILSLHLPFCRNKLEDFQKTMHKEKFTEPSEVAPYRHIPNVLTSITKQCLAPKPEDRYQTVEELISDVQGYLEGRSGWFHIAELDINNKDDWEFQENVLIADQVAITRGTGVSDWVTLMISKASFSENVKVEAKVCIGKEGQGIGFLIGIPETTDRVNIGEGLCMWLASPKGKRTKLMRSTVEVMSAPSIVLEPEQWISVAIEKIDNSIHVYVDDVLQFSYISQLPLVGTHVGLLARDGDFRLNDFFIYVGSHSMMVNCLAVPDAFLANKNYDKALIEYRRISHAFPSDKEGREAMFRAGITLMEQARDTKNKKKARQRFDAALEEFEKLHATPGALLEYLGKALVYKTMGNYEDEIRCFELALRRYHKHPLKPLLQEQIVSRMHDASRSMRIAAYSLISLVVRHFPDACDNPTTQHLFQNLQKHWEPLYFFEEDPAIHTKKAIANHFFATAMLSSPS